MRLARQRYQHSDCTRDIDMGFNSVSVRPSVRLSLCLCGIVSKRILSSNIFQLLIGSSFYFLSETALQNSQSKTLNGDV